MTIKFPPPPFVSGAQQGFGGSDGGGAGLSGAELQRLNRWLIEIQNILNAGGLIDPDQVEGLVAFIDLTTAEIASLTTQVAANAAAIAALTAQVATNTANIATNTANIATNTANIVTLTARNQILNGAGVPGAGTGANGDLYINNTGAPGSFLYGKIGGAWQVFA